MKISSLEIKEKRYTINFGSGLYLRIHPSGNKSWVLRIPLNGRTMDITLGRYPKLSEKQAVQIARTKRKEFELKPPKGATVRDAFALWCQHKRHLISYKDERNRLKNYVLNRIGSMQLDEITPPLILNLMKPLEQKRATLKRVLLQLNKMFMLSVAVGYIQHNPCHQLIRIFPPRHVKSMPSLPWQDLPDVLVDILQAPKKIQLLFLVSICTLLRPNEVVSLRYDWINGDTLIIPREIMKMKREFRLPITPYLSNVFDECRAFFGGRSIKILPRIHKQALARYLHDNGYKDRLVAHGLRAMGRNFFADHDFNHEASEMCLAHTSGSATVRAYLRTDYLDARRTIMTAWHQYISDCATRAEKTLQPLNSSEISRNNPPC